MNEHKFRQLSALLFHSRWFDKVFATGEEKLFHRIYLNLSKFASFNRSNVHRWCVWTHLKHTPDDFFQLLLRFQHKIALRMRGDRKTVELCRRFLSWRDCLVLFRHSLSTSPIARSHFPGRPNAKFSVSRKERDDNMSSVDLIVKLWSSPSGTSTTKH